ncbi:MAG TPA: hypothetical protein DCS93_18235 [Microscillaceae bacterium]|nr:hypothetical protein [Microscillaceae bacterium]
MRNILMLFMTLLTFQNCLPKQGNSVTSLIDYIEIYYISPYTFSDAPFTRELIEKDRRGVSKIYVENNELAIMLENYISSLKSQKGKKMNRTFSIEIKCKIFYKGGRIDDISFLSKGWVYHRDIRYVDTKKKFYNIVKNYLSKESRWHEYMK